MAGVSCLIVVEEKNQCDGVRATAEEIREEQYDGIFTPSSSSYLRCDHHRALWIGGIVFSQGFPPASSGWKRIFRIYADYVRKWCVYGVYEAASD